MCILCNYNIHREHDPRTNQYLIINQLGFSSHCSRGICWFVKVGIVHRYSISFCFHIASEINVPGLREGTFSPEVEARLP